MNDLAAVALETVAVLHEGAYEAPSGRRVVVADEVQRAVAGTRLVRAAAVTKHEGAGETIVEVTAERTGDAARRLVVAGASHVGVLNFANGVHPGGGFLRGARAQEEALCRCSALFACLSSKAAAPYYEEQRAAGTALVLDHVLVSPAVPFFRDDDLAFLEEPFFATVLTAAAPDLGWLHATTDAGREPSSRFDEVPAVFARRARFVLAVAREAGIDALVLGAWGCGAFGNDPVVVADAFASALDEAKGAFARVVFAVWDSRAPSANRAAFEARFGSSRGAP